MRFMYMYYLSYDIYNIVSVCCSRLELVLVTLKNIFDQQKTSGDPVFTSQV